MPLSWKEIEASRRLAALTFAIQTCEEILCAGCDEDTKSGEFRFANPDKACDAFMRFMAENMGCMQMGCILKVYPDCDE